MEEKKIMKLQILGIKKAFGSKQVLNDISFDVESGKCIGIVGANGCGKTTLFNIIAGESKPQGGTVLVVSTAASTYKAKDVLGYIPQENPLIEDLSTIDNLKLWYCDSKLDLNTELSNGVLALLGINEFLKTKVKHLSGGMKKRLSIGIALAKCPHFLMLDEPSAALDLVAKNIIRDYLKQYKIQGGGIILATHDEEELALCDTVYALKNGVLEAISPTLRGSQLISKII